MPSNQAAGVYVHGEPVLNLKVPVHGGLIPVHGQPGPPNPIHGSDNNIRPELMFSAGVRGGYYDPSDMASMFQDTAGTIPCAINSPVARINDKSGQGNHLIQATAANQPILRAAGGLKYLDFDGVNDVLVSSGSVDLSNTSKLAIFCGVTLDTAAIAAISANAAGGAGVTGGYRAIFNTVLGGNGPLDGVIYDGVGSTNVNENAPPAAPRTRVHSLLFDYAGAAATDEIILRTNGAVSAVTVNSGPVNTVNFANGQISMGDFVAGGGPLDGRIYGLVVLGKLASAAEISNMEIFMNSKTQAY